MMETLAAATGLPLEDIEATYRDWSVVEDASGWLLHKGTEVHVCAKPWRTGPVVTRRKVREVLGPIFQRYGMLTSRDTKGSPARVLRRLGFKCAWSDGTYDYYILTALPYQKEN